MKTTFLLIALAALALTSCSNGSYHVSYTSDYRPIYRSPRPVKINREYYHYYQPERPHVVGPQYRRFDDNRCGPIRYKNYSDAPVVVKRYDGTSLIIPKSWD